MPGRTLPFRPDRPAVVELAAGVAVVRNDRPQLLLLHEPVEDRWCLPKGHVEPGETLEACALRELTEETGLARAELGKELGEAHYRFYDPSRDRSVVKTSVYFLALTPPDPVQLESTFDSSRWLDVDGARQLITRETERAIVQAVEPALREHRRTRPTMGHSL
ncbi:MAG: NUDIX domain-containing protein [Thermoplasmata archaeon]|nr:NUDIX domain-containing protein [Thermoplasmata archaeon]MCI4338218.1 NUDIX domain-containing protein [Thermoplasmata archaeon]MCI4341272.1 NUDIX domain-containing protein [Thermoplasmata archaeon]